MFTNRMRWWKWVYVWFMLIQRETFFIHIHGFFLNQHVEIPEFLLLSYRPIKPKLATFEKHLGATRPTSRFDGGWRVFCANGALPEKVFHKITPPTETNISFFPWQREDFPVPKVGCVSQVKSHSKRFEERLPGYRDEVKRKVAPAAPSGSGWIWWN